MQRTEFAGERAYLPSHPARADWCCVKAVGNEYEFSNYYGETAALDVLAGLFLTEC